MAERRRIGAVGLAAVVVASAVLAFGLGPGTATAQDATRVDSCTTITEPGRYVLVDDIENSTAGVCIDVRASDVAFDGGGHTIAGNLSREAIRDAPLRPPGFFPWSPRPTDRVGVRVGDATRVSNVTVANVTTTRWLLGVLVEGATNATVRDVTATGDGAGIYVEDAADVTVAGSDASNNLVVGVGLVGDTADRASEYAVVDTVADGNRHAGVWLTNATRSALHGVVARENEFFGVVSMQSPDSVVANVTASDNGFTGVTVEAPRGAVVRNVTLVDGSFTGNGYIGLVLSNAENTTVVNASVAGTRGVLPRGPVLPIPSTGVLAHDASGNVLVGVDARDQAAWAYYAQDGSTNVVLDLETDAVATSFVGRDVAVGPDATTPVNATRLGDGLTVTNTSADAFVTLLAQWGSRETTEGTDGEETNATDGDRGRRSRTSPDETTSG
ncbi:right-handed parallel beta-helix repeat-containing protein [Halobacteriaceae archaeon GCM10025711]